MHFYVTDLFVTLVSGRVLGMDLGGMLVEYVQTTVSKLVGNCITMHGYIHAFNEGTIVLPSTVDGREQCKSIANAILAYNHIVQDEQI